MEKQDNSKNVVDEGKVLTTAIGNTELYAASMDPLKLKAIKEQDKLEGKE